MLLSGKKSIFVTIRVYFRRTDLQPTDYGLIPEAVNMNKFTISVFVLFLTALCVAAQEYDVSGTVYDDNGRPMEFVSVVQKDLFISTYTDHDGRFSLRLPQGRNTIGISFMGFRTIEFCADVKSDIDSLVFSLQPEALNMDEVVVTATAVNSNKGTSVYRVDDQAIKQIQAMNLSDILTLLPGNKMGASDFMSVQQANLRSAVTSDINNFGTSVIVNGMALSNDANMQTANPTAGIGASYSSVGGGIDLRSISASGIQSVEVITGVASAKYGNLASGTIIVKNKTGFSPLSISASMNSTSYQVALSKGFDLGRKGGVLNADVSYTYADESPVQRKNFYQNASVGLRWMTTVNRKLNWTNTVALQTYLGFNGQRVEPEEKMPSETEVNNQNVSLSITGDMTFKKFGSLSYTLGGSVDNQYSYYMDYGTGPLPLIEALESGTYITGYSSIFFKQEQIMKGLPVNLNASLDWNKSLSRRKWSFNFMTGLQYTYDKNFGSGRSIVGNAVSSAGGIGARNANFYEIPASTTFSAYHETTVKNDSDIVGTNLRLGLRYDFMNSRYHLLAPRLSATLKFWDRLSLRAAWGLAYKAPAMVQLYPGPAYFDYTNLSYYATNPDERLAIVSTYVYEARNEHLRPSYTNTLEGGLDWESDWLTVRLTAYHKMLKNGVSLSPELIMLHKQNYEVVDAPEGEPPAVRPIEGDIDLLPREKLVMKNSLEEISDGVELTLIPARIESTHTEFNIQGSYIRTTQQNHGYYMELSRYVVGDAKARYGVYENTRYITRSGSGRITAIQQIPVLRLIFTLSSEITFVDYMEPVGGSLYPIAYYDGEGVYHDIPEADRSTDQYADLRREASSLEITDKKPVYANFHLQIRKETKKGHSFSLYANNFLWYNPSYVFNDTRRTLNGDINFGFTMTFTITSKTNNK